MKKKVYAANEWILNIVKILTMLMMLVTVVDVVGRYIGHPVPGTFEMTRYALAAIVFISLGYSQMEKVHISIDLLVTRLPILWQKILDVFVYLLVTITFSISFWQLLAYTKRLYDTKLITTVLRLPVYPWVFASAVGVLFFVFVLLTDLIDAISKLTARGENK